MDASISTLFKMATRPTRFIDFRGLANCTNKFRDGLRKTVHKFVPKEIETIGKGSFGVDRNIILANGLQLRARHLDNRVKERHARVEEEDILFHNIKID